MKHKLEVPQAADGGRVDVFVGEQLKLSRARVKDLFEGGFVRVDGKRVKKGVVLRAASVVEVELEVQSTAPVADVSVALEVLWEDDALMCVMKPAGVPSQPLKPNETGTLANALVAKYPFLAQVSDDPREAGLCHRLDIETSGVILVAKTQDAWKRMRAAFSSDARDLEKVYEAVVAGPIADEGTIDVALQHHGDSVRAIDGAADARPAKSEFEVIQRAGIFSFVRVRIITGVLHQVRAHLAAIGAPIVGDALYGGMTHPALSRFFLHAASLAFIHPFSGQRVKVSCPLPDDLRQAQAAIFPAAVRA